MVLELSVVKHTAVILPRLPAVCFFLLYNDFKALSILFRGLFLPQAHTVYHFRLFLCGYAGIYAGRVYAAMPQNIGKNVNAVFVLLHKLHAE